MLCMTLLAEHPGTARRAVAYEPPSEELTEALIVLARYVSTTEHLGSREQPFRPAQALSWLPVPPVPPALTTWSPGASCAPASLGPAGEPAAQARTLTLSYKASDAQIHGCGCLSAVEHSGYSLPARHENVLCRCRAAPE